MKIILFLFAIVVLSCNRITSEQINHNGLIDSNSESIHISKKCEDEPQIAMCYIYGDKVPIYESPYKSSKILTYRSWLDSLAERMKSIENYPDIVGDWVCVVVSDNKIGWIDRNMISLLPLFQTQGDYKLVHRVDRMEFIEHAIHESTLINKKKGRSWSLGNIDTSCCFWVNEMFYYNKGYLTRDIWGFDTKLDSSFLITSGCYPIYNNRNHTLIFLREYTGFNNIKKVPIELIEYNLSTKGSKLLFKESTDSTKSFIILEDWQENTKVNLEIIDEDIYYTFILYQDIGESEYQYKKILVKVDEFGNLIERRTIKIYD